MSGEGRTADEIPLTTKMRPKKNAEDINRNNIYFTLTDTADNYVIPQTIEKKVTSTAKVPVVDKKADIEKRRQEAINQATTQNSHWSTPLITTDKNSKTPIKITWWSKEDMINDINSGKYDAELSELTKQQPSTQAQAALAQQAPAAVFVLDGTTNNTISIGTFGTTTFKLNAEEYIKTNGEKGFTPTFDGALVQALMDAKGYDSEKAQQVIGASIIAKVQPLLDAIAIPVEPAIDPIPQTEQDEWNTAVPNAPDDTAYRIKLVDEVAQFEKENWSVIGWHGGLINIEDEWRSVTDVGPGEVDVIFSYYMAMKVEDALGATGFNIRAAYYRNADIEFSLRVRQGYGRLLQMELPLEQARHHGYYDTEPEYRDAQSKKTYDRILDRFRGKNEILVPRR